VSKAEECRRLAEQCLGKARAVSKQDVRAALLQRAQMWLELAQSLEQEERREAPGRGEAPGRREAPPLSSVAQAQPPMQQQQQVQPDENDDKK
jgi:hypothetical protein